MITRIIPRLDVKGPNLVKGVHLEGLRVLGRPEEYARYYSQNGADELIYQDVVASLYERNSLYNIVEKTAKEIFIPLTVGGGIRSINDINNLLHAGADKVSINTAAVKNPLLISEASRKFGSSTIVVTIEAIKSNDGKYYAFIDNGREETGLEVVNWAKRVEELGAGELLITSVDREGTFQGFDVELIESITKILTIPVIVHGGLGNMADTIPLFGLGVSGICAASVFHYERVYNGFTNNHLYEEGNIDFLLSKERHNKKNFFSIIELKKYLFDNNYKVRYNIDWDN